MSAVFADNGNVAARLESHALDVRSHRARFLDGLLPCVVFDQTTTDRLGQPDLARPFFFVPVNVLKKELFSAHFRTSLAREPPE